MRTIENTILSVQHTGHELLPGSLFSIMLSSPPMSGLIFYKSFLDSTELVCFRPLLGLNFLIFDSLHGDPGGLQVLIFDWHFFGWVFDLAVASSIENTWTEVEPEKEFSIVMGLSKEAWQLSNSPWECRLLSLQGYVCSKCNPEAGACTETRSLVASHVRFGPVAGAGTAWTHGTPQRGTRKQLRLWGVGTWSGFAEGFGEVPPSSKVAAGASEKVLTFFWSCCEGFPILQMFIQNSAEGLFKRICCATDLPACLGPFGRMWATWMRRICFMLFLEFYELREELHTYCSLSHTSAATPSPLDSEI